MDALTLTPEQWIGQQVQMINERSHVVVVGYDSDEPESYPLLAVELDQYDAYRVEIQSLHREHAAIREFEAALDKLLSQDPKHTGVAFSSSWYHPDQVVEFIEAAPVKPIEPDLTLPAWLR